MSSHKSLLSDFYGIALAGPADATAQADGDDGGDTTAAGGSDDAYSAAHAAPAKLKADDPTSLTSKSFDSQQYLNSLLVRSSMRDLIHHDNSMISSKRALDSEMQTLVYDNYNKFISATDMIRKMKSNVESMEKEMHSLQTNMARIQSQCHSIETSLRPNREKVEDYLGVSRLLKRLEFLFELPGRLAKSIELGAVEQAVRYWLMSSRILQQYEHMQSFRDIQTKSEGIIDALKTQMRKAVRTALPPPGAPMIKVGSLPLSSELQMSYTALLVCDLSEPEPQARELMEVLTKAHRERFKAAMERAKELANIGAAAGRKASLSGAAEHKDDHPSSASSAAVASTPNLLSLLHQHFLNPFILFADTYLATLVRPYEAKLAAMKTQQQQASAAVAFQGLGGGGSGSGGSAAAAYSASAGGGGGGGAAATNTKQIQASLDRFSGDIASMTRALALTSSSLLSLSTELFVLYFATVKTELLKCTRIAADDDASRVILSLTSSLKDLYAGLARPMQLVPRAGLDDRATEMMQKLILACVEGVCDKTVSNALELMDKTHSQAVEVTRAQRAADAAAAAAGGSVSSSSYASATLLPTPAVLSASLRKLLDDSISLLVVLLSTSEYLPASLPFPPFASLAHGYFETRVLQPLSEICRFGAHLKSEGCIFKEKAFSTATAAANGGAGLSGGARLEALIRTKLSAGSGSFDIREVHAPLFYLLLSQVALVQEARDLPAALKTLNKFFPLGGGHGGNDARRRGAQQHQHPQAVKAEHFVTDLLSHTREASQALLLRFVETHGFIASGIVRDLLVTAPVSGPVVAVEHPSAFVDRLQLHFARVSRELALLFPQEHHAPGARRTHSRESSSANLLNTSGGGRGGINSTGGGRGVPSGAGPALNRDIARLFTQKSATFPGVHADAAAAAATAVDVESNRTAPLAAVARIAFKAMMETVRMERLMGHQLHQLQLDVCALRSELSSLLPSAESDTIRSLYVLLDETVNSAQERAPAALAIDEPELRNILEQSRRDRDRDRSRAAEAAAHSAATSSVQHSPQTAHAAGASSFYADAAAAALPAHVAVAAPATAAARPNNPAAPTGALARLVLSPPGVQQHHRGGSNGGGMHGPPH